MPNVHLTPQMQEFAEREIATGAYANLSEIVRAGMRKLMEERGAAAFYALKADLEHQIALAEAGETEEFDPRAFEPDAFPNAAE
jgi:antitoxin ParD1/3/4